MARWLVTGAGGQLGLDLQVVLAVAGLSKKEVTAKKHAELDITDVDAVREAVRGHDVVVNAAHAPVDGAQPDEAQAFAVNATGTSNLAIACRESGARLVHVSCADVFAGDATDPYAEDAPLAPRSAYGRTKAAGEWAVQAHCPQAWIVRTGWLYGAGGANVVTATARRAREGAALPAATDQRGQPTWTMEVAEAILRLVDQHAPFGVWHATSQGETTRYGFVREIVSLLGLDPALVEATTDPLAAPGAAYAVLGHDAWRMARLPRLPHWQESLAKALPDILEQL
jgi:dTDP-4-dehydrorhamnose reductase